MNCDIKGIHTNTQTHTKPTWKSCRHQMPFQCITASADAGILAVHLFVWDVVIDISILQLHWLRVLFSVSSIFRVASINSDIPLTLMVQFFTSHLDTVMCLLSREHTAMFPPLRPSRPGPTEIGSQQGSWFIGHFTRKAWGCCTACPTILKLSCQVRRCRSSVSVKAYLHCTARLSVVTTGCLLTFTPEHSFACRLLWFRPNRDFFFF